MIEFSCRQCGNELKVDDSKVGRRGKCPRCASIIVVPDTSTNQLIFVDNDKFFSDKKLNQLYTDFLQLREDLICAHRVLNEESRDKARFEIIIGNGRTQLVWLDNYKVEDGESLVVIYSVVGEITLMESAIHALRSVDICAPYCIGLSKENYLFLSSMAKITTLDIELLDRTILMVAVKADELEETLFGIDKF